MPLNISTEKLTDGEAIALGAIEIVSIPHISIIDGRENAITEIVEKYRDEMSSMLGEVYQAYKSMSYADGYLSCFGRLKLFKTSHIMRRFDCLS